MMRTLRLYVLVACAVGLTHLPAAGQTGPYRLSAVDLYGLRTVPEAVVRAAVGLRPGDASTDSVGPILARVRAIPGVADADVAPVCCADDGGALLFVGIREHGTAVPARRAAPTGAARLPDAMMAAGEARMSALMAAVRRGSAGQENSRGYALSEDSAMRAEEERYLAFAATHSDTLRAVLRTSSDAEHRALAAEILAYGTDRAAIARHLLAAVDDPDGDVRNNAVRALAVLAEWAERNPEAGIQIPPDPFIALLNSVEWSDRNKGAFALLSLTGSRSPALLGELRARACPALVEMARWTNPSHAMMSYIILARTAGVSDGEAIEAFNTGRREEVIARAATCGR
jgi:hypothetical protein